MKKILRHPRPTGNFPTLLGIVFIFSACASPPAAHAPGDTGSDQMTFDPHASSEIPAQREFAVNPAINPCQDFYGYACSKVNASFRLRDDRSSHTFAFSDSDERLLEARKTFLDHIENEKHLSKRGNQLKIIYAACMNPEAAKKEETEEVARISGEMAGLSSPSAFQNFLGKKIDSSDYSFLAFDTIPNLKDPTYDDVVFLAELQSLPERSYYDKPDVMTDLQTLATDFFKTVGRDRPAERAAAVLKFEKTFSQTYPLPAEFRELLNVPSGISRPELQQQYPHLEASDILSKIPTRTHIRNIAPKNFAFLNEALEVTPLDTLKDLYLFHSLGDTLDDAYPAYFKKRFDFIHKHLGGPQVRPDRKERCTKLIMSRFGKEIDAELLPRLFPHFKPQKVVALADLVRAAILEGIRVNPWLSEPGRASAEVKMKVARLQLVKPTREKDWDFNPLATYSLDRPHRNLKVLRISLLKKTLKELNSPRNKMRWDITPLTVNAYYDPADNKFVLPIGILQPPFYDPSLSDKVNLGAVGAVVGHELGHGIDDKGARYDSKGRFHQWMSDTDIMEFERRGGKLKSQFDRAGHNGELTLGENIGDLVGVTFAYRAAFPRNEGTLEEKRGFFLQYGRLWCNVIRPKFKEMRLKTNPHALGEARVNEQVKHQPGFAQAFACKKGDPMVMPEDQRVIIW